MGTRNYTTVQVSEFIITGFDHLSHQNLFGVLILITYILILFFCCTNLTIILSDRRLHSPMYILICNLAIVDIMFSSSSSITMIGAAVAGMKVIAFNSCVTSMITYHLGDVNMCLTITLMAVDRMVAITFPLRYNSILTNTRCIMAILACWMIGLGSMVPNALAVTSIPYCRNKIRYVFCDYPAIIRTGCLNPGPFFAVSVMKGLWLFCHLLLILASYVAIVYTVLRLKDKGGRKKTFSTCFSHIIVVLAYYAPKIVSVLLTRVGVKLNLTERNAVIIVASMLPPLINPVTYCLTTKELRRRLLGLVSKKRVTVK